MSPKDSYGKPPDENRDKWSKHFKSIKTSRSILLPLTDSYRNFVIARNEAILMRTLVAIVVRLLRRLKKPSRNDDFSQPITAKKMIVQ
ncbi:hypothetical protein QFZ20_000210 [Flavobacterium sp. W4I14]|nr:hypothetical protein [Flavobacterium sp. W4I14]